MTMHMKLWAQVGGVDAKTIPCIERMAKEGGVVSPLPPLRMEPWRGDGHGPNGSVPAIGTAGWVAGVWASQPEGTHRGAVLFHDASTFLFPHETMPYGWALPREVWINQHVTGKYRNAHAAQALHWLAWYCDRAGIVPDLLHSMHEGNQVYVMDWQGVNCPQWPAIEALCMIGDKVSGFPKECVGAAGIKALTKAVSDAWNPVVIAFNNYMRNWEAKGLRSLLDYTGWRGRVRMSFEHQIRVSKMVPHPWRPGYVPGQIVPDTKTSHVYMYDTSEAWHSAYEQVLAKATPQVIAHLDCTMLDSGPRMTDVEWKASLLRKHAKKISDVIVFNTPPDDSDPAWSAQYSRIISDMREE